MTVSKSAPDANWHRVRATHGKACRSRRQFLGDDFQTAAKLGPRYFPAAAISTATIHRQLLALSRYLLIAADPSRFAENVLAELRGWFDEEGNCPFWDNVASKFFHMPFEDADRMSASTDGQFILDLAPRHPIYVGLLPEEAREVVSRVHREGEGARALLEREGFRANGLVDIFDAGPTMVCPRDDIRTVRESQRLRVQIEPKVDAGPALVAVDDMARFRSVRTPAAVDGDRVTIEQAAAELLGVRNDDVVRVRI
jgi:arginine N-succinyltransferase